MCVDCLTEIVADATGFAIGSVSIMTTPMTSVADGYVCNAFFKGSESEISTLNTQVLDGSFETAVEAGLAASDDFTTSDITVSNLNKELTETSFLFFVLPCPNQQ